MTIGDNCLVCLLRQNLITGIASGFVNCYCPHSSNTNIAYFETTWFVHIRGMFVSILIYILVILEVGNLHGTLTSRHLATYLTYIIYICSYVMVNIRSHLTKNLQILNFNSLQRLIDHHDIYGIQVFIKKSYCKLVNLMVLGSFLIYFTVNIFLLQFQNIAGIQVLTIIISYLMKFGYFTQYMIVLDTFKVLFLSCFNQIHRNLEEHRYKIQLHDYNRRTELHQYTLSLEEKCKLHIRLYLALYTHFRVNSKVNGLLMTLLPAYCTSIMFQTIFVLTLDVLESKSVLSEQAQLMLFLMITVDIIVYCVMGRNLTVVVSITNYSNLDI